jgi:hypothetical protein
MKRFHLGGMYRDFTVLMLIIFLILLICCRLTFKSLARDRQLTGFQLQLGLCFVAVLGSQNVCIYG